MLALSFHSVPFIPSRVREYVRMCNVAYYPTHLPAAPTVPTPIPIPIPNIHYRVLQTNRCGPPFVPDVEERLNVMLQACVGSRFTCS